MLLESPPEPLASPMEEECLYADTFEKSCEIVKVLSGPKKNTFLYICMFLNELLKYGPYNNLDSIKLGMLRIHSLDSLISYGIIVFVSIVVWFISATIFGRILLNGNGNTSKSIYRTLSEKDRDARRTTFMHTFLCNDIKDFAREILSAPI